MQTLLKSCTASSAPRNLIGPKQKRLPSASGHRQFVSYTRSLSRTIRHASSHFLHLLQIHAHFHIPSDGAQHAPSRSQFAAIYARSKPNPFMQLLYLPTKSMHASCGSLEVEKSIHSSRAAFSSLHTQQGLTFVAASLPGGLFEAARLLTCRESEA